MSLDRNILTIYYKHKPGGFCKRLQMKINAYLEQGWRVHYIAVQPFPYQHPNLTPHILPTPFKHHNTLIFWGYFFALVPWFTAWVAWREKVNLISIFSLTYACLCAPAKWISGAPLLTFIRTMKVKKEFTFGQSQTIFPLERFMEKIGVSLSDSLVANCISIKDELEKRGQPHKKIQILYNNIDDRRYDKTSFRNRILKEFGLQDDTFLIVSTGLLIARKNQHCLLNAIAGLKSDKVVLLLMGDGPLREPLQTLSQQQNLQEKTRFTGWRDDVLEVLQGCDLFIFSSYLEGLSNSILEALACQLPCYVSDIPENSEIISRPEQRFHPDQPEALTKMIQEVLDSGVKLEALRLASMDDRRRFVFNWNEQVVEKADQMMRAV